MHFRPSPQLHRAHVKIVIYTIIKKVETEKVNNEISRKSILEDFTAFCFLTDMPLLNEMQPHLATAKWNYYNTPRTLTKKTLENKLISCLD